MVKVDAGGLSAMGSSVSTASNSRSQALNQAISSFAQFAGASDLKGKAYDSAKNYQASVLTPLLQGLIIYTEAVGSAASTLSSTYASLCGGESLDSDQLEAEINSKQASVITAQNLVRTLSKDENVTAATRKQASDYASSLQSDLNKTREKLRKLNEFDRQSSTIVSNISTLEGALKSGTAQVVADFKGFNPTNGFPSYQSGSLDWVTTIRDSALENSVDKNGLGITNREQLLKTGDNDTVAQNLIVEIYNSIPSLPSLETNDWTKRLGMILKMYPDAFIKKVLKSEEFWTLADKLPSKYQTGLINTLAEYEKLGDAAAVGKYLPKINTVGKAYEMYNKAVSPVKTFVSESMKSSTLYQSVKQIKFTSVLGKVANVATYADLAVTFGSSAINEYGKTGSVGKAAIGGTIDTIKSIGPFEGMALGASFGFPGIVVGGVAGLANKAIQFAWPNAYDNAKKWSYEQYDKAVEAGKSLISDSKNFVSSSSKQVTRFIDNIGSSISIHKIPFIGGT